MSFKIDELFHTYDHATATNISKIDDTIKTPWDPTKPIEMFFKQVEDAQIFALRANLGYELPLLNIYVYWATSLIQMFFEMISITSAANITLTMLIGPNLNNLDH